MINEILSEIGDRKLRLEKHQIYSQIDSLDTLKLFMERHVFAVFDFMSLTKSIQSEFAPIRKIWTPPVNSQLSRFINEIILAEESDRLPNGSFMSHFEIYLKAMEEIGADTSLVRDFVYMTFDVGPTEASAKLPIPTSSKHFMNDTFNLVNSGKIHEVAASFCFGREKIIPIMFQELLTKMNISETTAPMFYYYLNRHIEIDSDTHGPLALQMLSELCGHDQAKWHEAKLAALDAIDSRIQFWDNISFEIQYIPASMQRAGT